MALHMDQIAGLRVASFVISTNGRPFVSEVVCLIPAQNHAQSELMTLDKGEDVVALVVWCA
jgi:hypothetical protein